MDKSESSPEEAVDVACQDCGAVNYSTAKQCWMCKASLVPLFSAKKPVTNDPQSTDHTLKVTIGVLFVVLCLVGLGCIAVSRWLGIAYFLVVTPGFLGVLGAVLLRRHSKQASTLSAVVGSVVMVCVLIPVAALVLAAFFVLSIIAAILQVCGEILGASS